jgi:hypothetical protein
LQDQVQIEDELEPEREATLDFAVSSPAPAPFFKLNNEKSKRTFLPIISFWRRYILHEYKLLSDRHRETAKKYY